MRLMGAQEVEELRRGVGAITSTDLDLTERYAQLRHILDYSCGRRSATALSGAEVTDVTIVTDVTGLPSTCSFDLAQKLNSFRTSIKLASCGLEQCVM